MTLRERESHWSGLMWESWAYGVPTFSCSRSAAGWVGLHIQMGSVTCVGGAPTFDLLERV